jgi:hypothetical protein
MKMGQSLTPCSPSSAYTAANSWNTVLRSLQFIAIVELLGVMGIETRTVNSGVKLE